jgi:DNA helicase-2/ATP-dependent DNA helicase PcrA
MFPDLNPAQREVVLTESGPLLVLAGAGTGKTRVVTYRIARLIQRGTDPDRILGVTFTKKAAAEMQGRVTKLLTRRGAAKPLIATFHSLCVRVLRRHIDRLGYPKKFAIYDRGQQESVARGVLRDIHVPGALLKPSDLLYFISQWKMKAVRPSQAAGLAGTDKEHLAAMGYRRYQTALKASGAVDFDDLLLCTEDLFAKHASVRRDEAARFDHVLVDEYQDTNLSQYRIVKALAAGHRNLCVVGDDDQSIYAWRGAEVRHILGFRRDWPEAKVVRLEENYRSTEQILKLANQLIAFNKTRYDKVLRAGRLGGEKPRILQHPDETTEAKEVVLDIQRHLRDAGCEHRDFAILFRTNEQPRAFETQLRRAGLPYVLVGGMSFYDRKEVRDVMAYLKVLETPHDEVSLLRALNTPARGVGQKTVAMLLEKAVREGQPLWDVLPGAGQVAGVPAGAADAIGRFVSMVGTFRGRAGTGSLAELASDLLEHIGYRRELSRLYVNEEEQQSRWAAVEEIVNALGAFERDSPSLRLGEFLDEMTLAGREFDNEKEKQLGRNAIALMTLHSAKGLEFPQVYMVGMEEGLLPHHRSVSAGGDAIDEERRLCYVGITRAKERLTLSLSRSRMKWGKPRPTDPSRFLFELSGQSDKPSDGARRPLPPQSRRGDTTTATTERRKRF